MPGRLLGLHAFTKILVGYLLATIAARTVVEKPAAIGGLLAAAVVLESLAPRPSSSGSSGARRSSPSPVLVASRAVATGLLAMALDAAARYPWRERRGRAGGE